MINKLIIICFICLAYPVHSSNQNKLLIEAGKPKIQQAGHAAANELVLSVGVFDPLKEKLVFQNSKTTNKPSSYSIIQFHKDKLDPQSLKKMGIKIVSYMPNNAYVVKLGQNKKSSLTKNEQIRWVGEYIPDYKISPNLYNTENTKSFINLEVTLFSDYNKKYSAALIKKHLPLAQFSIPYDPSYSDSIILKVTKKDIDKTINSLALIDAVKWVNRYNFNTSFNTEAAPAVQANKNSNGQSVDDSYIPDNTPIWDKGITGSGQIVAVADSGLDTDEDWFVHYDNGQTVTHAVTESENTNLLPQPGTLYPDRKVIGYFTMPLAVAYDHQIYGFHGTHVTGSIAGDRRESISAGPIGSFSSPTSSGYDNDDGMAPNAQLLFQDCGGDTKTDDGHGELIAPIICFGENMFKQAYNAGARIHSNSYGAANNGYSTS
ncbi:MAG TPA: hypothetical protein ENJ41_00445, partial [Oceanospirillales bacterium]|nr:hypothetical protein [Oceanospirillales bacterium]